MSDTIRAQLDHIDRYWGRTEPDYFTDVIRAVLGIHKPFEVNGHIGCDECSSCPDFVDYPCRTVRAIAAEMFVPLPASG
jgi:hypothetical protein